MTDMKSVRNAFLASYEPMKKVLLSRLSKFLSEPGNLKNVLGRSEKILDYTVTGGKGQRAVLFIQSYQSTVPSGTESDLDKIHRLAWLIELLQAYFLVCDDIMDNGETRRGKICWHKREEIGLSAVNDALLLETCMGVTIKEDFQNISSFARLADAINDARLVTVLGQMLDTETKTLDDCTLDRYKELVRLKTSHYSFFLPVQLALCLTEANLEGVIGEVKPICYALGYYFQAQDDYLDCFGTEEVTGKTSRDIEEGKCTWPLVTALASLAADSPLRKELYDIYGKTDAASVARVREIYHLLEIPKKYEQFEDEQNKAIGKSIKELSYAPLRNLLQETLSSFLRNRKF